MSALHLQPKADGSLRPCGDYRKLNALTGLDGYALPNIASFSQKLAGSKVFAKVDMTKAYYNVGLDYPSSLKTVVVTQWGAYRFTRLSMGLKNSAQTFQRLIDNVLHGMDVFAYIDDVLVYAKDEDELEAKLRALFIALQDAGLAINAKKCSFGKKEINFLGFRVSATGIRPLPKKMQAVVDFPTPTSAKALLGFLGAANYYRRCLPKLHGKTPAQILQPLYTAATAKRPGKKFVDLWREENLDRAYAEAKQLLVAATELAHPNPDAHLVLTTDASVESIGAVLEQHVIGRYQPLGWWSKHLTPAQRKWSTFRRELYGIHQAVRHFLQEFRGRHLVIFTDHLPIVQAIKNQKTPEHDPVALQHLIEVCYWTHDVRHVKGKDNPVSDWLSRPSNVPVGTADDVPVAEDIINDVTAAIAELPQQAAVECARAALTSWAGDMTMVVMGQAATRDPGSAVCTVDGDVDAVEVAAAETLLEPGRLAADQAKCPEVEAFLRGKQPRGVTLAKVPHGQVELWCDTSGNKVRPLVPAAWRQMLARTFHELHHPGPKSTAQKVSERYYWPTLKRDVTAWTKTCDVCQSSKATAAIRPPMDHRPVMGRFDDVQCDVVGPLPPSQGYTHLLTVVDRATNWLEAVPLVEATAQTCCEAFLLHWVARKGIPSKATCDNGNTFATGQWTELQKQLGVKVEFTPLYHAASLGSVERQHKDLKVGLRARLLDMGQAYASRWMEALPWVLLGRRTSFQPRFGTSSAEMVYGSTLQVPGDLLRASADGLATADHTAILTKLRVNAARPPVATTGLHDRVVYYPATAANATHVYVKKGHPTPLGPIKAGPFPIAERLDKSTLRLLVGHRPNGEPRFERHHWENCQPAALAPGAQAASRPALGRPRKQPVAAAPSLPPTTSVSPLAGPPSPPAPPSPTTASPSTTAVTPLPTSRSGRAIKPTRRNDFVYS